MDIEGWLRSLGLEKYEAAFRENEIDDTILPKLTAEDLKELGVGPVGHRRKLLDAIAALRADANAANIADFRQCRRSTSADDHLSFRDRLKLPRRALNTLVGIEGKGAQPEAFRAEIDPITTFAAPMEVRTCPLFLKEKWLR